jgi:polar amino acid transport system substrate-binding protein
MRFSIKSLWPILLSFALVCFAHCSFAASAVNQSNHPIKVGVIIGAPIAYQDKNKTWHGIVVNIWEDIAAENGWQYEFIPMGENVENAVNAVSEKKLDVLLGPITVTYSRLQKVDFSRPFMINKVVVLERGLPLNQFGSLLLMVLAKAFNTFFLIIAVVFFIIAHIIWLLERKTLKEYGQGYFRGILHTTWSLLMLLVGSQLVDRPKHHLSRFLILLVIFLSITFSSLVAAAFTSSLTLSLAPATIPQEKSIKQLQSKTFASVQGQSTGPTMQNLGGDVIYFGDLHEAIQALKNNPKIDAIVGDSVLLKYNIAHTAGFTSLSLTPIALDTDEYAVAFQHNSSLRQKFDYSLTKFKEEDRIMPICLRYLAEQDAAVCVI